MSVDDIRKATFDKKVKIIRAGGPINEEYLQVSLVTAPPPNRYARAALVCTIYFTNDQYINVLKGDQIGIFEEVEKGVSVREDDEGERYES